METEKNMLHLTLKGCVYAMGYTLDIYLRISFGAEKDAGVSRNSVVETIMGTCWEKDIMAGKTRVRREMEENR